MRRLLVSTFVSLAWVVPAMAQDAPQVQSAAPNAAQQQDEPVSEGAQSIQRNVRAQLALAGFTDIELLPTSFLVRAKDADGNPVMLMLSPDSISQLQELAPGDAGGQDDSSNSDATSPRPPAVLPPGYDAE
jgi:hypothetical protein